MESVKGLFQYIKLIKADLKQYYGIIKILHNTECPKPNVIGLVSKSSSSGSQNVRDYNFSF
jgi:hypothetical protein